MIARSESTRRRAKIVAEDALDAGPRTMSAPRSPTMADIARQAGVALSTVSYALSGKRSVSDETLRRVQRAIKELGYQPHAPARALASRSSHTIALFFPATRGSLEVENHIFLAGVAEATSEAGYSLLVSTAAHDPNGIVATLDTGRADGVILMEIRLLDDRVERLRVESRPFSLIGHCADNTGISYVDFDFEDAVVTAVHHLHELGHRHVAILNRAPDLAGADYGPAVRSRTGFERAVGELSIKGDHLLGGAAGTHYIQVLRFLERNPSCTAVITLSVTFAPLLAALRDLGRRVPEDFSVVAILAPDIADLVTPPLTTVDLPAFEMGRIGAEILIHRLGGGDEPPTQLLLRGQLEVRSSQAPRASGLVAAPLIELDRQR
jgi:DNA-binding LacI/PurR family transcriptional regulator